MTSPRAATGGLIGHRFFAVPVAALALALACVPAALAGDPGPVDGFIVNETGDQSDAFLADGPNACDVDLGTGGDQCTLRAAIEESNATAGPNTIDFNIPGAGVHTIAPATAFPDLTSPVTINGFSQPGASPNTQPFGTAMDSVLLVELNGTSVPADPAGNGFTVASGAEGTTIRGLVINRFTPWAAIELRANDVTIEGNYIGTNPAGDAALGNGDGVFGFSGTALLGGALPEDRNLVSGNVRDGAAANSPLVAKGNYIGVASDGKSPLGNGDDGLSLFSLVAQAVGGPADEANVIAYNGADAIEMVNASAGTPITNNRIYENAEQGIDLNQDGATPNDEDDADGGPNELQNYPKLTLARTAAGVTKVKGNLNSVPELEYTLEFFMNKVKDREGRKPIGTKLVTTGADGDVSFGFKPATKVKVGRFITATATNPSDSTSEFSGARRVTAP